MCSKGNRVAGARADPRQMVPWACGKLKGRIRRHDGRRGAHGHPHGPSHTTFCIISWALSKWPSESPPLIAGAAAAPGTPAMGSWISVP